MGYKITWQPQVTLKDACVPSPILTRPQCACCAGQWGSVCGAEPRGGPQGSVVVAEAQRAPGLRGCRVWGLIYATRVTVRMGGRVAGILHFSPFQGLVVSNYFLARSSNKARAMNFIDLLSKTF